MRKAALIALGLILGILPQALASYTTYPAAGGGGGTPTGTPNRAAIFDGSGDLASSTTITTTEVGFLDGVTSSLCGINQSCVLTNKSLDADTNTISNIDNDDIKAAAAIDAAKLADGSVSSAEFQYINSLSSNAQTQIDGKQATGNYITALTGDITASGPGSVAATIAAGVIVDADINSSAAIDASKIADGSVSSTEYQYLGSVTSSLCGINQSCTLTNKTLTSPVINTPTGIVKGDVGLGNVDNTSDATKNAATATLTNKTISVANNTVGGLTINRAVITDGSGNLSVSSTTTNQLSFLNSATSNIQTQLDAKAATSALTAHTSATTTVHGIADTAELATKTGAETLTNKTINGSNNTISNVDLTTAVTGTLPVTNGGTGTSTALTQGSIVFAGASGVYSQDVGKLYWDSTNTRMGINTASPSSMLFITGQTPAAVGTTPGTAGTNYLGFQAGVGGGSTITTTGVGGVGSGVTLALSIGGSAQSALVSSTGGKGGGFSLSGGPGGGAAVAGTGTNTGGIGGDYVTASGTGGAATGATSGVNSGGAGGAGVLTAGNGGGASGSSTSNIGGVGGSMILSAGGGGIASGTGAVSGSGGTATLRGGSPAAAAGSAGGPVAVTGRDGSTTGSGGNGGAVTVSGGSAGGDNTVNRSGGNVTISAGTSKGSSTGGGTLITGGVGGVGTGSTGAAGGFVSLQAGTGGANTTGGSGGQLSLAAGLGGSGGGVGGDIIFRTAATTSLTTAMTISNAQIVTLANALPVGSGGTGITSPGASGNVLTSNGSAWVSSAPASGSSETVAARYTNTAGTSYTAATEADFVAVTQDYDSDSAFSSPTFTVPTGKGGRYRVTAQLRGGAVAQTGGSFNYLSIHKNGSFFSFLAQTDTQSTATYRINLHGSDEVTVAAGDTLKVRVRMAVTNSLDTTAGTNYVIFSRIGD